MNTKHLPNLDVSLLAALDFFSKNTPTPLKLEKGCMPFVVGSGNAYNTGKIIFSNRPAIFANESNFQQKLKAHSKLIKTGVVSKSLVISASGEKDATWEVKAAKKQGLKTIIMTCNSNSSGAKEADMVIAYRKLAEPQTYNISTYLGMILSATGEKALDIKKFIKSLRLPTNYAKHSAYSFILPDEYAEVVPMLDIKKHELFGPHLSIRSFTYGDARHAKFVMPWEKELVISFGENKYFGNEKNRWEIKMPKEYGAGLVMALAYYLIGKIQEAKPAYYKKSIATYCLNGPRAYGKKEPFEIVVPGN